jgi:uracil-DNA glycosylase
MIDWARTVNNCYTCDISFCKNKVLDRGEIPNPKKPIHILFVGEAPGASEYANKQPFIGPAGQILDSIIDETLPVGTNYLIINAVLCTPFENDSMYNIRKPFLSEITACRTHLRNYINIIAPERIVALGKVAESSLRKIGLPFITVAHPSAMLQSNYTNLEVARAILKIRKLFTNA